MVAKAMLLRFGEPDIRLLNPYGDSTLTDGDRHTVQMNAVSGGDPTSLVIRLSGELDVAGVEATKTGSTPYLDAEPRPIHFDLEKLTFMDSSGIALLVVVSNDFGQMPLIHVPPIVGRVLEITRMLEQFGMSP